MGGVGLGYWGFRDLHAPAFRHGALAANVYSQVGFRVWCLGFVEPCHLPPPPEPEEEQDTQAAAVAQARLSWSATDTLDLMRTYTALVEAARAAMEHFATKVGSAHLLWRYCVPACCGGPVCMCTCVRVVTVCAHACVL